MAASAVWATSCSAGAGDLDVGDQARISIYTHCGVLYLVESIDERHWMAVDLDDHGVDPMPTDWNATESERIDVVVELVGDDVLAVTPVDGGVTVHYRPTASLPGCD